MRREDLESVGPDAHFSRVDDRLGFLSLLVLLLSITLLRGYPAAGNAVAGSAKDA
jgi:hypothetical protein